MFALQGAKFYHGIPSKNKSLQPFDNRLTGTRAKEFDDEGVQGIFTSKARRDHHTKQMQASYTPGFMQQITDLDGNPMSGAEISIQGILYRLDEQGRLRNISTEHFDELIKQKEEAEQFIISHMHYLTCEDEMAAQVLGLPMQVYDKLMSSTPPKKIGKFDFSHIPDSIMKVNCTAHELHFQTGSAIERAMVKLIALVKIIGLPVFIKNNMTEAKALKHGRTFDKELNKGTLLADVTPDRTDYIGAGGMFEAK